MTHDNERPHHCPHCGYRLVPVKDAYDGIYGQQAELPECPRCKLGNPLGYVYMDPRS